MTHLSAAPDGSSGLGNTDFYLRKVLAGELDEVRARLVEALEALGYRVMSEQPLQAKRSARGLGALYISSDVLEYPTKLTVALKSLGAGATLATFDYEVTHTASFSTKGDRQTLRREAEAILALAAEHGVPTSCQTCGAHCAGDSRFCRLCGAHCANVEPAELEVLRLTAGARAGHQLNVTGMVFALAALIISLLLAASGKAVGQKLALAILALGETIALVIMCFGASYLHNTLNRRERAGLLPTGAPRTLPPTRHESLPPPSWRGSVTEGTTGLLEEQLHRRAPDELRRD